MKFKKICSFVTFTVMLGLIFGFACSVAAETDVTEKVLVNKGRMLFDRMAKEHSLQVSLTNISQDVLLSPIKVIIDGISNANVTVANADGVTTDGKSYFEYRIENGRVLPTEKSDEKQIKFSNPTMARFSYTVTVLATIPDSGVQVSGAGGMIEHESGVILDIPAGSLSSSEFITATQIPKEAINTANITDNTSILSSVSFTPHGLTFNSPIAVSFPLSLYVIPGTILPVYLYDGETGQFMDEGVTGTVAADGLSCIAEINHFSEWVVGIATSVDDIWQVQPEYGKIFDGKYSGEYAYFDLERGFGCASWHFKKSIRLPNYTRNAEPIENCSYKEVGSRLYASIPETAINGNLTGSSLMPVLFIHGFQRDNKFGGGYEYWGNLMDLIHDQEFYGKTTSVFDFQWRTNARFQDVAEDLFYAVKKIHEQTGQKVHIIAHSMGGVLARTMLQKIFPAELDKSEYEPSNYVASLFTLGALHSGIADKKEDLLGIPFPDGQDSFIHDYGEQLSMYQTGEWVGYSAAFKATHDVNSEKGEIAAALSDVTANKLPKGLPIHVAIGMIAEKNDPVEVETNSGTYLQCSSKFEFPYLNYNSDLLDYDTICSKVDTLHGGDGLISFDGQRFHPSFSRVTPPKPLLCNAAYGGALVTESVLGVVGDKYRPGTENINYLNDFSIFGYYHSTGTLEKINTVKYKTETPVICKDTDGTECKDHATYITIKKWFESGAIGKPDDSLCQILQPPVAKAGLDQNVTEGTNVLFSALGSYDSDGEIVSYQWNEGAINLSVSSAFSKSDFTVGEHVITLVVTDSDGYTAEDTVKITVTGDALALEQGLVAYYSFDGNANDVSGNGHHGTEYGGVSYTSGVNGQSARFDGVDDYIDTFTSFDYPDRTVAVWANADVLSGTFYNNYTGRFALTQISNELAYGDITVGVDKGQYFLQSASDGTLYGGATTNTWFQIVLVRSGGMTKHYINGVLVGEFAARDSATTSGAYSNLVIGSGRHRDMRFFDGLIDELKIYNRALSDSEIHQLYTKDSGNIYSGLVAYYPFDGNTNDVSGNGHHGTEYGGVSYTSGVNGQSARFDGVDDYFKIPTNEQLRSNHYSVSFWMKTATTRERISLISGMYSNGPNNVSGYQVNLGYDSSLQPQWVGTIGSELMTYPTGNWGPWSTSKVNDGRWNHVTTTYDGLKSKVYINGVLEGTFDPNDYSQYQSGDVRWAEPFHDFYIGKNGETYRPNYVLYDGLVDELRIYNRALSDSEIQQLYTKDSGNVYSSPFDDNFDDNNYTSNPSWSLQNNDDYPGAINVSDGYLNFLRSGAGGNGGWVGVDIYVDIPVTDNTTVGFDALARSRSVGAGCGWNCREYPANVRVYMTDSTGAEHYVTYAVNYGGAVQNQSEAAWSQIVTNITQGSWERNLSFNLRTAWPQAVKVSRVILFGAGWDFDGGIDNLTISE